VNIMGQEVGNSANFVELLMGISWEIMIHSMAGWLLWLLHIFFAFYAHINTVDR
jgi:hypothetical protein